MNLNNEIALPPASPTYRAAERTLWTLYQDSGTARCTLRRRHSDWELRMLIDELSLLVELCASPEDVLALAYQWKSRLRQRGWREMSAPRSASAGEGVI